MTEFDDVIRLLEENRPQASNQELDAIKQRVRRRAADPSRRSQSMKSRLAILGMLITGFLFSTAGVGLALSGGHANNASIAQYGGTPTPTPVCTPAPGKGSPNSGSVSPSEQQTGTAGGNVCEEGGVLPAEAENAPSESAGTGTEGGVLPAEESETQPERQEA